MHRHRFLLAALALALLLPCADLPATPPDGQATTTAPASEMAPIDINRAGPEELQQIKGIGPALALRIVRYREENGPFHKPEEIINVRGIGEKTFLRIKDRITVGNPADRAD